MAPDPLLLCSICPAKPAFSDVSHLLTHVGSKGHLANLHKLQVQSQYDYEAVTKIENYNNWFTLNDLASLLSQRQVQKETKKASKKIKNGGNNSTLVKTNDDDLEPTAAIRHMYTVKNVPANGKQVKSEVSYANIESDEEYVPTRAARQTRRPAYETPVKRSSSNESFVMEELEVESKIDPSFHDARTPKQTKTPNQARLKGVIWPGMGLYDAARPEDQKRRNQRKDGSVVKRMEELAGQVERKEVVRSLEWSVKKERDIDDLEDASSLVDGETPVPKRAARPRKRKALAPIDGNVPRFARKKNKPVKTSSPIRGRAASSPKAIAARGQDNSPPRFGRLPSPTVQRRAKGRTIDDWGLEWTEDGDLAPFPFYGQHIPNPEFSQEIWDRFKHADGIPSRPDPAQAAWLHALEQNKDQFYSEPPIMYRVGPADGTPWTADNTELYIGKLPDGLPCPTNPLVPPPPVRNGLPLPYHSSTMHNPLSGYAMGDLLNGGHLGYTRNPLADKCTIFDGCEIFEPFEPIKQPSKSPDSTITDPSVEG